MGSTRDIRKLPVPGDIVEVTDLYDLLFANITGIKGRAHEPKYVDGIVIHVERGHPGKAAKVHGLSNGKYERFLHWRHKL